MNMFRLELIGAISDSYGPFLGLVRLPSSQYMNLLAVEKPDSGLLWRMPHHGRACLSNPI